jgi:hypothetical protein
MADLLLAFLAVGAVTLTSLLYRIRTVRVQHKKGMVDGQLLVGILCSVSGGRSKVTAVSFLGRDAARLPPIDSHFDMCSWS